ncbi:MAG: 4-carboxymuconolactone decarboxylase [Mycobacterium sp.]|jgi:4-carboxymuconolactone decarboxylase|nr:4-carboxymuconolactone decarboxylase [Mycobacterium sp.]
MSNTREEGLEVLRKLLPDLPFDSDGNMPTGSGFASGLLNQTLDCVFGNVWTRPGLDWRSRSLVTVGILIALRAEGELRLHLPIALRNGVTREELEEVIYHAAAYAGFPAASTASRIGNEVLG